MDVRHPPSGGAGVELGPVVIAAALWSKWGSVQPLRTDPRQKPAETNSRLSRIEVISICRRCFVAWTVPPRVGRSLEPPPKLHLYQHCYCHYSPPVIFHSEGEHLRCRFFCCLCGSTSNLSCFTTVVNKIHANILLHCRPNNKQSLYIEL